MPSQIIPALRRAFTMARNGRPGPVLLEVPGDMWNEEVPGTKDALDYKPVRRVTFAPAPSDVDAAAAALLKAKRPLIYAGQGVHYAKAWKELKDVVELVEAPVTTSLEGKSSFPETHPLSTGSGGVAYSKSVFEEVNNSDLVFGVGASFTATGFGIRFPTKDKEFIHNTNEPGDINKNITTNFPLLGDSKLTLEHAARSAEGSPEGQAARPHEGRRGAHQEATTSGWMNDWMPKLTQRHRADLAVSRDPGAAWTSPT